MMTSDEPIILIGGPGHPRGRRPGTETAGVVAYPLDPENLLVLFRPDMMPLGDPVLNHADMADINREVAASAFRWVFERGTRNAASKFVVPRRPEALSLIEGPLELSGQPSGEVFRFTRSNRWEVASVVPPWPVPRWWAR